MRNFIKKEIEKVVGKGKFDVFKNEKFGDYSSNVAMVLNKDPKEIAKKIKSPYISKIEVVRPGFLNFWLSEKGLEQGLEIVLAKSKKKKEKIQVEFISANPLGDLHIGHGRNGFYGNVLANVLEEAGYKVEREFFINDSKESTQVKSLIDTVSKLTAENTGVSIPARKEKLPYETKYLREAVIFGEINTKNAEEEIQKHNQEFITKDLGIKFDIWFSEEKELRSKGEFKKTLELLEKKNLVYKKDGALWLKTSEYGDDEDRVLVRSTGDIGYFLSDIAYHINKFKRKFDIVINIWGADHQGHVKRMLAVKKMLGWKGELKILICQLVTLKEAGEAKKMSKRTGTIVWLKDLIKEVGVDVVKWFCLEKSLSTQMEFDMALAKEQSLKNPVYYVQYAGARIQSILKKSQILNPKSQINFKNLNDQERNLILKLIQFPEIIEDITKDYQVHHLTTYAYGLAKVFTDFYEKVPVLKAETEELKKSRLNLIFITRKILSQVLSLLGISTPEEM